MRRAKPGATGQGDYFRIEVRPERIFTTFRYHDIGSPGKILRLAGKRISGSWGDQAYLIEKDMAHVEGNTLVADEQDAENILQVIGPVKRVKGDIFRGHPRYNVPEKAKPTSAQKRARASNIKKAQASRREKVG